MFENGTLLMPREHIYEFYLDELLSYKIATECISNQNGVPMLGVPGNGGNGSGFGKGSGSH